MNIIIPVSAVRFSIRLTFYTSTPQFTINVYCTLHPAFSPSTARVPFVLERGSASLSHDITRFPSYHLESSNPRNRTINHRYMMSYSSREVQVGYGSPPYAIPPQAAVALPARIQANKRLQYQALNSDARARQLHAATRDHAWPRLRGGKKKTEAFCPRGFC